jgi:hypothetical protein
MPKDDHFTTGIHLRMTPDMMLALRLYQRRYNYQAVADAVRAIILKELQGEGIREVEDSD